VSRAKGRTALSGWRAGLLALAALAVAGGLVLAAAPEATGPAADWKILAETDRAFAKTAGEKGVKDAFLAFLADDSILFHPGPVPGKAWFTSRPAQPFALRWSPEFAEISAGGDLGVTMGPYEATVPATASAPADTSYGHYVTVWKLQDDHLWKVAADLGVEHPSPRDGGGVGATQEQGKTAPGGPAAERATVREAVLAADRAFGRDSLTRGTRAAFLEVLGAEARVLREGSAPIVGHEAIQRAFSASGRPELLAWEPGGGDAASSGDLAYTYGSLGSKEGGEHGATHDTGSYLRVWERQGDAWKVIVDILHPWPPPSEP
jgi:hypothetical protein